MNEAPDYDVAILGGGLAGNLLARQLRRQLPDLHVGIFERSETTSFKVGESSVEIASNYFTRRLGLTRYLYENQLPKNGLRFFFDTQDKDGDLESLSEIGSVAMAYLPAFQLDRARFEADLRKMNRDAGAETRFGRVQNLALSGEQHTFELSSEARGTETISARWVVDAAGRSGLIARPEKLWVPEGHEVSAVWGRFSDVVDLDDIGGPAFRGRVNHTSRFLSTTHFCYPGYWIWFIPLGRGIVSVGVVMKRDKFDDRWRKEDGFVPFLRGHASSARLLEGAKLLDVGSYKQLAYGTKRFFGDRWACIGEAGAFADPLYSPGSDFIAMGSDFTCDLIRREIAGSRSQSDYVAQRERYDAFLRFRHEATLLVYRDLYSLLGSYEAWHLKWDFDIACYYNMWLEPYMRDEHLDPGWLDMQLRQRPLALGVLERFSALFQRVEAHLRAEGRLYEKNLGELTGSFPAMRCAEGLGSDASSREALARTGEAFNDVRHRAFALLGRAAAPSLPMRQFLAGKDIW